MTDTTGLSDEKQTLLIPLYGKALDCCSKHFVLNDRTAREIVEQLGIDLTKHKRIGGNQMSAVRARQYDQWTRNFLAKNPNAVVVHLGCGLDARVIRTQPPSSTAWFDIDYPEVIDLRKIFYAQTGHYKMIASSITAPGWLETIPADRPALIVAEGVFEYLSGNEVKALIDRLTGYFPHGQIAFDVMNSFAIISGNKKLKKTTGAINICKWAVDNINDVNTLNPKLKLSLALSLFKSIYIKELPFVFRFVSSILTLFPRIGNGMRLLLFNY